MRDDPFTLGIIVVLSSIVIAAVITIALGVRYLIEGETRTQLVSHTVGTRCDPVSRPWMSFQVAFVFTKSANAYIASLAPMPRGDKTPLELFLVGILGWEARLRRILSRQVRRGRP
jgi:hypothetical protein